MHRFQTVLASATLALLVGFAAGCPDASRTPTHPEGAGAKATAAAPAPAETAAPGSTLMGVVNARLGVTPKSVVGSLNGKEITLGEVDAEGANHLADAEHQFLSQVHQIRQEALESYIDKRLFRAEAKKRGLADENALIKKAIVDGVPPPTDAAVKKYYDANKVQFRGAPFATVKPRLQQMLAMQAKRKAFTALLAKLTSKAKITKHLPVMRTQVAAVGPSKGPKNAPVTIVEFSDFQCPYCKRVLPTVDKIIATYGDKVRLVRRDFPLPFHQYAEKAAEAGACADAQGHFWRYHDKLYANQDKLDVPGLKAMAATIPGINAKKFDKCLDSGAMKAKIESEIAAGKAAGVNGTPAFFIDGISVSGAQPFSKFQSVIDKELARTTGKGGSKAD